MSSRESNRPSRSPEDETPSEMLEDASSRRKNVRAACIVCKKRKLKCSGFTPCENCKKSGSVCGVDETGDQRRKRVLKRKLDSLDEKGRLLDRLVLTLQESNKACAAQITNLIRGHGTLDELRAFIDDIMERPRLEKTPELIEACTDFQRLHESKEGNTRPKLETKDLSDIVLFRVPAFPWTTVIENDDFVSHLISLWFTWTHPFLNWIDKDLFIRDMRSKDPDSGFCSPFLVNIILADACAYSEYPESYAVGRARWSRGLHFYKEAKRLLDQKEGKFSLPDVQGLGVLYVCSCMMGKDRSGWFYYSQLAYAVNELAEKHRPPPLEADKDTLRDARAVDIAIWGLFNLASMTAVAYQKRGLVEVPKVPHPSLTLDFHKKKWSNYPSLNEERKNHNQCVFRALCDINLITHDLSRSLFGEQNRTFNAASVARTEEIYTRLRGWQEKLPDCLAVNNAPPHVISVHLKYHTQIQTIFGLLKDLPKDENCPNKSDWIDEARQRARQICVAAAQENGRLINLHRDLWGLDQMPPVNIHWVTVSMFTLLDHLEEESSREALVRLSVAAKAFSNRWPLGKGMLRLFQVTSKQNGVVLPTETDALFTDFEARFWTSEDRKVFSSQYPNFANSIKHGEVDDIELDSYLAKFDELHITVDDEERPVPESEIGSEEELIDGSDEEGIHGDDER